MAYTIQIDEEQRQIIVRGLTSIKDLKEMAETLSQVIPQANQLEHLDILIKMFDELPDVERDNPGILHGFCL